MSGGWKAEATSPSQSPMADKREKASREFSVDGEMDRRASAWSWPTGAIVYLALSGDLHLHMVIATLGGVFFSVVLGCGLMAATFFSDKSGHDENVTDATAQRKNRPAVTSA